MTPEEAVLVQAGRQMNHPNTPDFEERAKEARAAVAARQAGLDQSDLLETAPSSLAPYIAQLQAHPAGQGMFADGWTIQVADLTRTAAIQPNVFTDQAEDRVRDVDISSLSELASITLPIPQPSELPAQYDHVRQAWLFASSNPNLRVVGNWGGEIQPGVVGFGFAVQFSASFLQVAEFRGRYFLRDGYHRAFGLLKRGVRMAPVFTKSFPTIEAVQLNPGMLPQDAYLGQRPATLADYLDETVSAEVNLPASQKMIVIQALELTPLG
jgi:hypothetical protein